VRVVTRNPSTASVPAGAEIVAGDLTDAESVREAFTGIERMFLYPPADSTTGTAALTKLAREQGVRHVVLLSSQTVLHPSSGLIGQIHRIAEQEVTDSGLDWTLLRPGSFASISLIWAWSLRADGVVRGQFPGASTNPVHEADVAAVATIALRTEDHLGATYHLTGPAAITQLEEMQQIGDAIGRTLRFEEQTSEQARAQLAGFTSPAMVEAIIGYYSAAAESGEPAPVVPTIEQITGRPARTFAKWAREHADDFR
jgi:uncharacterized protein YbjT (DUF2867 family)